MVAPKVCGAHMIVQLKRSVYRAALKCLRWVNLDGLALCQPLPGPAGPFGANNGSAISVLLSHSERLVACEPVPHLERTSSPAVLPGENAVEERMAAPLRLDTYIRIVLKLFNQQSHLSR